MRRILLLFLILICLAGAALAYLYGPSSYAKLANNNEQEQNALKQAQELFHQDRPEEAFAVIQDHAEEINDRTETGREWLDLLIRTSETLLNVEQLLVLNDYYPKAFNSHERAALLIANEYLINNQPQKYQHVRDNWKGREARPEAWFVLDSDKLLLEGKRQEAIDLLKSHSFHDKSDSPRLIRLSLLYVGEQPKTAWEYLTQAYSKDPENPDVRSYRAKLLEIVGKPQLALSEYLAATQTDPTNPYLKDQLAEYYIRSKQYSEALKLWIDLLPSSDSFWVKALFWSRVTTPISYNWHSTMPPRGNLEPLIDYLLALKPGSFWDNTSFERIPDSLSYLKSQQGTFWLRLIQDLKNGKEKEAYDLLLYNPFSSTSWNPHLEEALKAIILYRSGVEQDLHGIFPQKELSQEELHALLTGPEAFSAAFLNAGWDAAALDLHKMAMIPADHPNWVSTALTKAVRQNLGEKKALEFASLQSPSPDLSLLIGELLIATGKAEEALEKLSRWKMEDSDVGSRAAYLISLIEIEHGHYGEAKTAIEEQPRLKNEVLGKETLARIALLEGDIEKAEELYGSLKSTSTEAQSYLARKAYRDKNWKLARELTEKLLLQYPDNALLRENLKKIISEHP